MKDLERPFRRSLSRRDLSDASALAAPARRSLVGRHIWLEPLDSAVHGAELYEAGHGSPEALAVWDYLPSGPWADEPAFLRYLNLLVARPGWASFALRPNETGKASGMACYLDIQPEHGVIEIGGIWFAPQLQRTRAATEALFLMLSDAMDDLHYRRMQWRTNAFNKKSRQAARRLGFRFEGIFYNHMIVKGQNRDTAWYSILDDEWPKARKIIETWLDDENFDAGGKARRSLGEMMRMRDEEGGRP